MKYIKMLIMYVAGPSMSTIRLIEHGLAGIRRQSLAGKQRIHQRTMYVPTVSHVLIVALTSIKRSSFERN